MENRDVCVRRIFIRIYEDIEFRDGWSGCKIGVQKACILEMQIWEIVHVNRGSIIKHEVPLKRRENGFTATGSFIINFHSLFLFAARITVPAKSLKARNARRCDSFRENGSSFASSYKQIRCAYLINRFIGKANGRCHKMKYGCNLIIKYRIK